MRRYLEPRLLLEVALVLSILIGAALAVRSGLRYRAIAAENVPVWWVYPRPLYHVEFLRERRVYSGKCPFECRMRTKPYSYEGVKCPVSEDVTIRTFALMTAPCFDESVARDTVKALRKVLVHFDE